MPKKASSVKRKVNRKSSRKSSKKSSRKFSRKSSRKSNRKSRRKSTRKVSHSKPSASSNQAKLINTLQKLRRTSNKINHIKNLISSKSIQPVKDTHFGNTRVRILRNSDFDNQSLNRENSNRSGLVMFYAPWCPHCTNMIPTLNKLANDMSHDKMLSQRGLLGAVDCTEQSDLARNMNVAGYPTIKIFKNGKYVGDYQGSRDGRELKNFIAKLLSQ